MAAPPVSHAHIILSPSREQKKFLKNNFHVAFEHTDPVQDVPVPLGAAEEQIGAAPPSIGGQDDPGTPSSLVAAGGAPSSSAGKGYFLTEEQIQHLLDASVRSGIQAHISLLLSPSSTSSSRIHKKDLPEFNYRLQPESGKPQEVHSKTESRTNNTERKHTSKAQCSRKQQEAPNAHRSSANKPSCSYFSFTGTQERGMSATKRRDG